jgi:hypothetical protein
VKFPILTRRRSLAGCLVALVGALLLIQAPSVVAAPAPAPSATRHCDYLLAPAVAGQASAVVSKRCVDGTAADATALDQTFAPLGETTLIGFYEFEDYAGVTDNFYGTDGPCDAQGYGIKNMASIYDDLGTVGSYKVFNYCNTTELYSQTNFQGTYSLFLYNSQVLLPPYFRSHSIGSFDMFYSKT